MKIKIKQTNEEKQLNLIDPKTGLCWIGDLMGNHNALPEIETDADGWETDFRIMSQVDFDWWENLATAYQAADTRYYELCTGDGLEAHEIEWMIEEANNINCDLEDLPGALEAICDAYENADKCEFCGNRIFNRESPEYTTRHGHMICSYECLENLYENEIPDGEDFLTATTGLE